MLQAGHSQGRRKELWRAGGIAVTNYSSSLFIGMNNPLWKITELSDSQGCLLGASYLTRWQHLSQAVTPSSLICFSHLPSRTQSSLFATYLVAWSFSVCFAIFFFLPDLLKLSAKWFKALSSSQLILLVISFSPMALIPSLCFQHPALYPYLQTHIQLLTLCISFLWLL